MKHEPLATLSLNHAKIELWPTCVRTILKGGREIVAAPNRGETIIDTAIHEALHSIYAEAEGNVPSHCLSAVAAGDGRRWTPERKREEGFAFSMTPRVKQLFEALRLAYPEPR